MSNNIAWQVTLTETSVQYLMHIIEILLCLCLCLCSSIVAMLFFIILYPFLHIPSRYVVIVMPVRPVRTSGYFLKVLEEGVFNTGSEIILLERPNPTLSVQKVSEGLWGPPHLLDNSREFLTLLVETDILLDHLFRNTARERLKRLDLAEGEGGGKQEETPREREVRLAAEDEALAAYNFRCISVFGVFLLVYLYFFGKNMEEKTDE